MPDKYLHGNGRACRACHGTGRDRSQVIVRRHEFESEGGSVYPSQDCDAPCRLCSGTGREALSEAEIVSDCHA